MLRGNGLIDASDLKAYKSIFRSPLTSFYKGYKIITVPPPSSGGVILIQLLGMLEPYAVENYPLLSVDAIHLMVEAERRAFADRAEYLGDPLYMTVSAEKLINSSYLRSRMSSFSQLKASSSTDIFPGSFLQGKSEETTHYSVVDSYGNAVSATTTLNGSFGSKIVVHGAGFILNNQMDDFSIQPGYPNMYGLVGGEVNSIQPGKRILSSMTPTILEKEGKAFLVLGTPGGSTIPTTVFQVIVNVVDFGLDIKTAVDTSRFHHQWLPDQISYERNSFNDSILLNLNKLGHITKERGSIGSVNAIFFRPDGKRIGAADKRGDNISSGY
jgi:gamma-glutamyltranspeptidase/glutathione hydrolase